MKGRLWCHGMSVVSVPRSDTPKPITLVVPYYDNRAFFGQQLRHWSSYPAHLQKMLKVIVVDDGSPNFPAQWVVAQFPKLPFRLRLFRIDIDIRWNWLAARNIGFHYADYGWVLVTDMDHVVPIETLGAVVYGKHNPMVVYAFSRREHSGAIVAPHSASFLMTKDTFWKIGGYDEALSGHYGTDGVYRREIVKHAPIQILTDALVRYEYMDDSSTTTYLRKQPEDAAVKQLVAKRKKDWTPKVLSFPFHEVTAVA